MAEEINLEVNVKGGNAKKSIGDTRKELDKAAVSAKKVSDSVKSVAPAAASVKTQLKILKDEMSAIGDIGSPRFQKLAVEAGKLKDQMNNANAAIKTMSADFPKLQIGIQAFQGIGAAAQFAAGAQLLLGSENKELQKAMQRAMALTTMMTAVQSLANLVSDETALGMKLRNSLMWKNMVALKAWVAQTKVVILWQKLLNFVMNANPIVKIVTAVGLLIGVFALLATKVKSIGDFFISLGAKIHNLIEGMGAWKNVILALLGPIGWLIAAWDFFFGEQAAALDEQQKAEQAAFEERSKRGKENARLHREELNRIKEAQAARKEAFDEQQNIFDLEIARMDAEGKNSNALKQAKIEAILEEERAELETINNLMEKWTSYYEQQAIIAGKSREEYIAILKGQGIDVEALQQEALEALEVQNRKIFSAETDLISFKHGLNKQNTKSVDVEAKKQLAIEEKLIAARLKAAEKAQKEWETLQKKRADLIEKLSNQVRDNAANDFQKRFNKLTDDHEKEMELLEELIPEQNELRLQLERDYQEARREIQAESEEAAEQQRVDRISKIEEDAGKVIDSAEDVAKIVGSLNTIFHGKEIKRIAEKQKRGEKLTASEEKRMRKEAQMQKFLALAQIAADTARAISGAIAAGASIPFPGNIPAMISGVAAVLANVASASEVLGDSPDIPSSPASAVDSATDIGSQTPNTAPLTEGSTLLNEEPTKTVVVVESITDGINSVGVIEAQASFG